MPRRAAILAACALLTACATPRPAAQPQPERPATLPPHTITIRTSPPGGIIDWNGDVLGAAPVQLTFSPDFHQRPRWPANGYQVQILRARWPDGSTAAESFLTHTVPPSQVGIVSPHAIPEREIYWAPPRKRLPNKIP